MFLLRASLLLLASSSQLALGLVPLIYEYRNDVQDQAEIDLDLQTMQQRVSAGQMPSAHDIYEQGGHSEIYATLTLVAGYTINAAYSKGTPVYGFNDDNLQINGTLLEPTAPGGTELKVVYDRNVTEPPHCQVGGLYLIGEEKLTNCFTAPEGTIFIMPSGADPVEFNYTYGIRLDNKANRTLQKFSTDAVRLIPSHPDYDLFTSFYGQADYADAYIQAAFEGRITAFQSGVGNHDFSELNGPFGRGEAMEKGAAFLSIYMFVIGKLSEAVEACNDGSVDQALYSLDEAAAYYGGSMKSGGNFSLYGLANERGVDFNTISESSLSDGTTLAAVNVRVTSDFQNLQTELIAGSCGAIGGRVLELKNRIVQAMRIPLIQSVLAYAYVRARDTGLTDDEVERAEAFGGTFTAAILPYVSNCNVDRAVTVYNMMKVGSVRQDVDFRDVKEALEETYACMGVSCEDIGGIWDGNDYRADAAPCTKSAPSSAAIKPLFGVGSTTISSFICVIMATMV